MYLLTRSATLALLLVLIGSTPAFTQGTDRVKRERPAALVPLYLTFAGLQAVDVHSTMTAVDRGARETNPLVRNALSSPAKMVALKSGAAVGVVLLTERIWPHNRAAAVITMIALNSAYVTISAQNYRMAQRR
jgi:hypothetical protein